MNTPSSKYLYRIFNIYIVIFITLLSLNSVYGQTVYEFTTAGATGRTGPTQSDVDNEYSGTSLDGLVTINTQGIQEWTVPATGYYKIEVAGAEGGDKINYLNNGGKGVIIKSTLFFQSGNVLKFVVGQKGGANNNSGSGGTGGGGGSFFYNGSENVLYIAAGGGGGVGAGNQERNPGRNASTNKNSNINQQDNNNGSTTYASYVNEGNGGNSYGNFSGNGDYDSGGGAGWLSDGKNGVRYPDTEGGFSKDNNWLGGDTDSSRGNAVAIGGFGGGGAASDGGGGGGGYTGGNGGRWNSVASGGGGGSSFIISSATDIETSDGSYDGLSSFNDISIINLNLYNTEDGYITITEICTPTTLTVSSTHSVTYGDSNFDLTHTSSSTGTITYSTSNSSVADINSSGNVTINGAGTVTLTVSQASIGDYCADTATMVLTVAKKPITINGITANDKEYDSTTSVVLNSDNLSYNGGVISGDDVTSTFTGDFSSEDVGTGITVNLTGSSSGTDVGNYSITYQLSTTASITPKDLTIDGIIANDKIYDSTVSATLDVSNIGYNGLVSGDDVTANFTGVFSDPNTEVGKIVTLTGSVSGTDIGNYNISYQTSTTASITARGGLVSDLEFDYTGDYEEAVLPAGVYLLEAWGAQGGDGYNYSIGGKGAYAKGELTLTETTKLYIYVGGQTKTKNGGWNGGGGGNQNRNDTNRGASGGGATDFRLLRGTWDNSDGLNSRILVAGGGAGGNHGGQQDSYGGDEQSYGYDSYRATDRSAGSGAGFGYGTTVYASSGYPNGGGGGGWYGGGGITNNEGAYRQGSGGSSYAYTTSSFKPTNYNPNSKYQLTNTDLIAGNGLMPNPAGGSMTGRTGSGYAKISPNFICTSPSLTVSSTLSVYANDANFNLTHSSLSSGTLSYTSSDTDVATIDASTGEVSIIGTGTVTLTVSQAAYNDYCSDTATMVLTVDKTAITIVPSLSLSKVYGELDPTLTYTVSSTSTINFTGSMSRTTGESVGTYSYTTGSLLNDSYAAIISSNATNFSITPKDLTIDGITANDKIYDGTLSATLDVSGIDYNGLVDGDDVTASFTGVFSDPNTAADKTVALTGTVTGTDIGNYNISFQTSTTASITARVSTGVFYHFTNAGAAGRTGPTQSDVDNEYSGTSLDGLVTINTQGIQEWTVPATGNYEIEIAGAEGYGKGTPGKGAIIKGQIILYKDEIFKILVGQKGGAITTSKSGSGGGGSYFVSIDDIPFLVAGGGSGVKNSGTGSNGRTYSNDSNGGSSGISSGGGGFETDGEDGTYGKGGNSFKNGGLGGSTYDNTDLATDGAGGFGGGGSHTNSGSNIAGAGGGYEGGDGNTATNIQNQTGGGSYIKSGFVNISTSNGKYDQSSTDINDLSLYNSGHGYVKITQLCDPSTLTVSSTLSVYANQANFNLAHSSLSSGTLSYTSSDTDVATIDASTGEVSIIGAGTVTLTVSQAAYNDYCSDTATMVLTVTKPLITITPNATQSKTYGALDPTIEYTVSPTSVSGISDVKASLTGVLSRTSGENVGTYSITLGTLTSTNFVFSLTPTDFTINKLPVMIIPASAQSKTYGDLDTSLSYTTSPNGTLSNSSTVTFTGTLSRTDGADAGTYSITIGTLTNTNYALTLTEVDYIINKRPITISAEAKTKVYGASDPNLTHAITTGSVVSGDNASGTLTRTTGEDVETYSITQGTLTYGSNYDETFVNGTLTITARTITVTAAAKTKEYGASDPALTYTPTPAIGDPVVIGSSETVSFTGTLTRTAGENAGTYSITLGTLTNTNYIIDYVGADFTITTKPVYVTGDTGIDKTFDNTTNLPLGEIGYGALTGVLSGEDVSLTGVGVYDAVTAGSRNIVIGTVTLTGADKDNYALNWTNGSGTIAKKTLTVTANNDAKFVTESDTSGYNGVSYTGFEGDDSISDINTSGLSISRTNSTTNTAAGTYPGTLVPSGVTATNYDISYVNGDYTIIPADKLLLKVSNQTTTYGTAATYSITSAQYYKTGTGPGTGLINLSVPTPSAGVYPINDGASTINIEIVPDSPVNSSAGKLIVGSYGLTANVVSGSSGNFSSNIEVIGNHSVAKQSLTASANSVSKEYDATTAMAGVSLSLATLETGDIVTVNGTGSFSSPLVGTGLSYTIAGLSLSGTDANNYYLSAGASFSGNNGVITKAPLTVTAKNDNGVDTDPAYSGGNGVTYQGFKGSDGISDLGGTLTYTGSSQGATAEGIYAIEPTGITSSNYSITFVAGTLTIIVGDSDGDGVRDPSDNCPTTPNADQADTDGDGVGDVCDNAPNTPNADQADTDADGIGDVADTDDDNDGCLDTSDAFPLDPSECSDNDGDGIGDNADPDDDNDTILDSIDNCPTTPNTDQKDTDGDGTGDVCDNDTDNDGMTDDKEAACGTDPLDATDTPIDTDSDGIPDCIDTDKDNDGYQDINDAFPLDKEEHLDTDADGIGNNTDTDDDNDGQSDEEEVFCGTDPLDATSFSGDVDNDGITDCRDQDNDNDGVNDAQDAFPLDPSEWTDTDLDGIGNNADQDDDNDGFSDLDELECNSDPLDKEDLPADLDGDGIPDCKDIDIDGDGCINTQDVFPRDPSECLDTDGDGLGNNVDVDDDNDGVIDQDDAFPQDPSESKDADGDGIGDNTDTDDNNDGFDDEKVVISGLLTPNSSGMESTWKIVNIDQYPQARVSVYDKNGLEVFSAQNYRNDWKGTYKNSQNPLPAGSYIYRINLGDGSEPMQGWIYISY